MRAGAEGEATLNQSHEETIRLGNGVAFHRPEERIREYCDIEVYRDIAYRGGYDDHHNVTDAMTEDELEAADNLYANLSRLDHRRVLGNSEIPSRLAAVRDVELGEIPDQEWEGVKAAVRPLLAEFLSIPNIKLAKTMKVLHLKRPRFFPILDSFVVRFLTGNDVLANRFSEEELLQIGMSSLETARTDITNNREAFHKLEGLLLDLPTPLTVVRLYDILCWTQEKWVNRGDTSAPCGTARKSIDQGPSSMMEPPSISPTFPDVIKSLAKPSLEGEITNLKEFRQIVARARGLIVITGTSPPRAHQPLCNLLTDDRFNQNIVLNEGESEKYYWRSNLLEARRDFGALPCKKCRPGWNTDAPKRML